MSIRALSGTALVFVSALALTCVPRPAFARHGGGSHGGGSSHGGGKAFHGGHSSFKGSGHFSGGSRNSGRVSSARRDDARKSSGRLNAGSFRQSEGSFSRPSGNFSRNSNFGRPDFSASNRSSNFGRFSTPQAEMRGSREGMGAWHSFENSTGRSLLASA